MTTGRPCYYCGARPDVSCFHREADEKWKVPKQSEDKKRVKVNGGGNYKVKKRRLHGL